MPSLLSMGAGASGGLDDFLNRMLTEQKLKQQGDQIAAGQAETSRHNLAEEDVQSRQHQMQSMDAQARIREQQGNAAALDANRKAGVLRMRAEMRPIGSIVSPEEKDQEVRGGIPSGLYGEEQPPSMGSSTATGEVGPSAQGSPWKGTQDQITKAVTAGKHGDDKGVVHDTEKGLVRVYADGTTEPVVDSQGSVLKGFHQPQQPVVVNTGTGPSLVDRNTGRARNIVGQDNQPVSAPASAQERNRSGMAAKVLPHFDDVQSELEDAEKAGALGPIAGRTFGEFLAGKVGSTGDATKDDLLGALRMDMSALRSGFATLHGRGGANAGIAKDIEKNMDSGHMSFAELNGALREMKKWVAGYADKPAASGAAADGPKVVRYDMKGNIIP